jgi:uncharacterized protein (TIGR00251 family)
VSLRVSIRVTPGAPKTVVGGRHGDALVVRVPARAVDGRATEAALRAVATALGVRRRDVRLVSGTRSRQKIVEVTDESTDPAALTARVDRLLSG